MNEPLKIPTHFRFLNKKEANHYGETTENWNPISEIHFRKNHYEIAAFSFAWVSYNVKKPNLEFKIAKFTRKELKEFEEE